MNMVGEEAGRNEEGWEKELQKSTRKLWKDDEYAHFLDCS